LAARERAASVRIEPTAKETMILTDAMRHGAMQLLPSNGHHRSITLRAGRDTKTIES
jgi:hypothetical protein